jgi:carboxyl-terminal processing protease
MTVYFETRQVDGTIPYVHWSAFFDPASLIPRIGEAITGQLDAPGLILDLRGNPGGIGAMAMGICGWLIDESGLKLGTMTTRDTNLNFVVFPRAETFQGPVAVLVDGCSASTSEIFAGGLQDLGRARIFGTRTAGAALPSIVVKLPNGDGFQYAFANYVSVSGATLEGTGVIPDEEVRPSREGLLSDGDPVLGAAIDWIRAQVGE